MNYIIPGRLASEPCGPDKPLGHVTDDAIMVLNSDHKWYEDAKSKFCKVCRMDDLCFAAYRRVVCSSKKKGLQHELLKAAVNTEHGRRKAEKLLHTE